MVGGDGDCGGDDKQSRADGVGFIQMRWAGPNGGLIVQEAFGRAAQSDFIFLFGDCLWRRRIRQTGWRILRGERRGEQAAN